MELIIKCEALDDQYECDANKTPLLLTPNWQKWYDTIKPNYDFEVWELQENNTFKCIKEWDEPLESGMVLVCYENDYDFDNPRIIKKYTDQTREQELPKEVKEYLKQATDIDDWLLSCGYITFTYKNKLYGYVEYEDDDIYPPC